MADVQQNAVIAERNLRKFVLEKCCFFVPLKIGCLILAYWQMAVTVVFLALSIKAMVSLLSFYSDIPGESHHIATAFLIFQTLSIVENLATLLFCILLVIGLHKGKRNFIKIYIIFGAVVLIIVILQYIAMLAAGFTFQWVWFLITVVSTVINTYFLLFLWSHYVKLGEIIDNLPAQHYRDGHIVNTQMGKV